MTEGVIVIDIKRVLRPFSRKLKAEAALKSILAGGLIVLPVYLIVMLIRRIFGRLAGLLSLMPYVLGVVVLLLYVLRYRPSLSRTAARIDREAQLNDRISTAVQYMGVDSAMARLQREDAAKALQSLSPSLLRMNISFPAAAGCVLLVLLTAAVPHVPQHVVDLLPFARQTESEEVVLLRGKIEQLSATIMESELDGKDKEKLLAQVSALLAQVNAGNADLSALQDVKQMMEEMEKTVVELTPRDTYAAAMLEYESLRPLGEAIFKKNMDVVNLVFDNIAYTLKQAEGMEQVDVLMDLVYDINGSLSKPLRDNSQENLRQGMMMLAGGLESAAEMVYNRRDNTQMIDMAILNAKEFVREFLGVPAQEERYDPYAQAAKERANTPVKPKVYPGIAKEEKTLTPQEKEHVYDPPEGVKTSGYVPGEEDENGVIKRIPAPADEKRDGTVPYGEVFGKYYAEYLAEKNTDAIPEKLRDAVEAYFNGI